MKLTNYGWLCLGIAFCVLVFVFIGGFITGANTAREAIINHSSVELWEAY